MSLDRKAIDLRRRSVEYAFAERQVEDHERRTRIMRAGVVGGILASVLNTAGNVYTRLKIFDKL